MQKAKYLILFLLANISTLTFAQDTGNFTQFFFNPYTLNPSFAGIDGRGAMFLSYRKQWSGIVGGPTISSFSYHTPLKSRLSIGINVANDKRGLLSNSGLFLTAAYSVPLGEASYLRFGLSGGGSWNTVDLTKIPSQTIANDPALLNLLNQSASVIGNFGASLHLKSFHAGFVLPNLFTPSYISQDAFTVSEVKPFEAFVVHASNRFYFADNKHIFEPYVLYRVNNGLPSQYEVAGVLHLNHVIWLGGSLKQEFGISAFGGLKLKNRFAVGGSYTLKNTGVNELSFPTYEIHLSLLGGASKSKSKSKSQTHLPSYSFVDTELKKLSSKEKLAQKKKEEALAKKKQQEELAKKEAEAKKVQEAEAKKVHEAEAKKAHETELARIAAEEKVKQKELATTKPAQEQKSTIEEKKPAEEPVKEVAADPKANILTNWIMTKENSFNNNHETVTRGRHPQELESGNYLIVGVFVSEPNARNLARKFVDTGFNANYGFLTEKNLWYIHLFVGNDINVTRTERDKYRRMPMFRNAWLLTVQN